jgi:pimeloyl-ACP methyl ester carboxylesterase
MRQGLPVVRSGVGFLGAVMPARPGSNTPLQIPIAVAEAGGVEQGYVQTAPGVFLYYRRLGAGPLLVLLHGGPGGDHGQLTDLDRLADRSTLLFYDQRGSGRSTRGLGPGQLTWRQHVEDLDAVREAFGQQRLRVLGYSWGGILLQLFAALHPDRVRRLVFVATALPTPANLQALQATMMSRLCPETRAWMDRMQQVGLLEADLEWLHSTFMRRLWVDAFVHPRHAGVFDLERLGAARSGKHTSASLNELADAPDHWRRLQQVTAPALAVHGTWDPMPLAGAKELVQMLPDARLVVIEDCGHMPWLEAPAAFFDPVREFLAAADD